MRSQKGKDNMDYKLLEVSSFLFSLSVFVFFFNHCIQTFVENFDIIKVCLLVFCVYINTAKLFISFLNLVSSAHRI